MLVVIAALLIGNSIALCFCLWKLQSMLLSLQHLVEYMTETKDERIGFRSDSAPPDGHEGEEIEYEYQPGEPAIYDKLDK